MSVFTDPQPLISELLGDAGVAGRLPIETNSNNLDLTVSAIQHFAISLPDVVEEEIPPAQIIIGQRHFQLGKAGWNLLSALAALGISTFDPTGLTQGVALQQGLSLFGNLLPLLRKLDAAELAVCTAIAQVTTEKMQTLLLPTPPGASEEEIVEHFVNQGKKPPVKVS